MRAGDKYQKMLYGGEPEQTASSLYSTVQTPLQKLPPIVDKALNNRESPTEVALHPRVDLLSKFLNNHQAAQDRTKVIPQESMPILTLPKVDPNEPRLPTGAAIRARLERGDFDAKRFTKETYTQESGGDYKAMSKSSTATGKYQFLWGKKPGKMWGDDIRRVTGVTSREQFRDSPKAQEKFYNYYLENHIKPAVKRLANKGAKYGLDATEVARVIHFQGEDGARAAFEAGEKALYTATKINPSIMEYLGRTSKKGRGR